ADRAALYDARSYSTAVDQRFQHGFADHALQVVAGWAVLHAFQQHLADAELTTDHVVEAYAPRRQVAAVLGWAELDAVLAPQPVKCLSFEQRHFARARIGRPCRIETGVLEVAVAGQALSGNSFDIRERLHTSARGTCDTNRFDYCHERRSIARVAAVVS